MSTPKPNKKRQYKLGKKMAEGEYIYSAKVHMSKDFASQVSQLMKEKRANIELEQVIQGFTGLLKKFPPSKRSKNIEYYHALGKKLSFIDDKTFSDFKPYSLFRRITEEVPGIVPGQSPEVVPKHLEIMYKMGTINEKLLQKGTWDQWFELLKFKDLYKNKIQLEKMLERTSKFSSGRSLRDEIKKRKTSAQRE